MQVPTRGHIIRFFSWQIHDFLAVFCSKTFGTHCERAVLKLSYYINDEENETYPHNVHKANLDTNDSTNFNVMYRFVHSLAFYRKLLDENEDAI